MKKIRYFLEALLLAFLMGLSKVLPVQNASDFGGWIGRTIGPKLAASRKAYNNIKMAMPGTSDDQAKVIVRDMWDNLGRVMMEYPHLRHIAKDRTEIIGADIIEKYKDKPVIIFAAHLGNWELPPPAMLLQKNIAASPIYRPPNNPISDKMLQNARTLGGLIQTIPKSKTGTRHIVKALQNNQHIGILIDQKYNEGVAVNFFDHPAMTSPAFVQLAQKFDCPLIPMRMERLTGASFRITVFPPLDIKHKSVEDVIAESHHMLEEWIKKQPGQWLWLHRRWGNVNAENQD
ncbi:MAG TPA: lipid A biosynthesis acyltransferase [Alphaproteobacteria bacterium]|nr:lipid A biosynthesis acyltransferase [Alphaproteobacteria bacterium]